MLKVFEGIMGQVGAVLKLLPKFRKSQQRFALHSLTFAIPTTHDRNCSYENNTLLNTAALQYLEMSWVTFKIAARILTP